MGRLLRADVHVTKEDHSVVILKAGDEVPKELAKYVTNPKAYVSDDAPVVEESTAGSESGEESDDVTVADLKAELKKLELPVSGTKEELVARLAEAKQQQGSESGEESDDDENKE